MVITGDGTAFPGSKGVKSSSIRDGTSQTILCVEYSRSGIEWTEPRDLAFDRMNLAVNPQTGDGMRTIHNGRNDLGCVVVLADGSSRYLSNETSPDLVKALITINGGERISESEF